MTKCVCSTVLGMLISTTEQGQHQHVYLDREELLSELRYQHSPGESFIRRVVAQLEVVCVLLG